MKSLLTGLAAGLILGGLLTYSLFRNPAAPAGPGPIQEPAEQTPLPLKPFGAVAASAPARDEASASDLEETVAQLEDDNEALRGQLSDLLAWIKANLPSGKPPPPALARRYDPGILDVNGNLDPLVAQELGLDSSEQQALNHFFRETLNGLTGFRTNLMQTYQQTDDQLFLRVAPFEEEGTALRNKLLDNLRSVLGIESLQAFMQDYGEGFDKAFFFFGKARQSISFKAYIDPDTGQRLIRIVDRYHLPQENGRKTIEVNSGSFTSLPAAYEGMIDWQPRP